MGADARVFPGTVTPSSSDSSTRSIARYPNGLQIHLILDNYSTHKHAEVDRWLNRHIRFHLHFTPSSSSWLNQVERWFRDLTDKNLRRGIFGSVSDLIISIEAYLNAPQRRSQTLRVDSHRRIDPRQSPARTDKTRTSS